MKKLEDIKITPPNISDTTLKEMARFFAERNIQQMIINEYLEEEKKKNKSA